MRPRLDWRGLTAFVLAAGIIAALILGEIQLYRNPNRTLSQEETATFAGLLGTALGAVAVYLGSGRAHPGQPDGPENAPQEPPSRPSDRAAEQPPQAPSGPGS